MNNLLTSLMGENLLGGLIKPIMAAEEVVIPVQGYLFSPPAKRPTVLPALAEIVDGKLIQLGWLLLVVAILAFGIKERKHIGKKAIHEDLVGGADHSK